MPSTLRPVVLLLGCLAATTACSDPAPKPQQPPAASKPAAPPVQQPPLVAAPPAPAPAAPSPWPRP